MNKKPLKRALAVTLAAAMLVPMTALTPVGSFMSLTAAAAENTVTESGTVGEASYTIDSEGTLTVTGESIILGADAFAGNGLRRVDIGCTSVRIHPTAFADNEELAEINFTSKDPVTIEGVIEGLTENTIVTIPLYSKKFTPAGKKFNYTEYSSENAAKRNDLQARYDSAAYLWEDTSEILAEAEADEFITVSDVAEKTEEFTKSNWNTTFPNAKVQHFGTMAGFGTMADPYRIENTDNWRYLAYMTEKSLLSGSYYGQDRGTYVKLMTDLTLSDKDGTFVQLGGRFTTEKSYVDRAYMGNFDGDGHTITLDVTNLDNYDGMNSFGLFAKTDCPYIKNLHISGQVISNEANTGLFIGHGYWDYLYNCSSDATIILQGSGEFNSGAFIGYSYRPTVENCHFTGKIIGDNPSIPDDSDDGTTITAVGGFVGEFSGSDGGESMKNCWFAPSEIKVGSTGSAMLYRPWYGSYSGWCGIKETENNYHNTEAEKLDGADMGDKDQGMSDSDGIDSLNETEFWENGQLTFPKADVQANPGTTTFVYTGGAHRLINDIQAVRSYSTGQNINEWDNFPYMPGYGKNGYVVYKVNDGEWSATPPTATEVGDYTVYYRAAGDNYHRDSEIKTLEVSIVPWQELPGSGTPADPYTISNDLEWSIFCDMRDTTDKYFKLTNDIVVSETRESLRGPNHPLEFNGVFDGDGHKITLYWVNNNRYGYGTSLFGRIIGHSDVYDSEQGGWHYWNATVKNLILDGIMINQDYTAPLAQSINHATVSNIISNMTLVQTGYGGDRCGTGIVHTGDLGSVNGGSHFYNCKVGGIFDNNGTTTDRKWAGITNMNDFWKSGKDFIVKDCYVAPDCRNIKVSDGNFVILGNHVEGKSTIDNCFYGGNFLDIIPVDVETGESVNTQGISDANGLDALYATGYWADGNPTMPKATITKEKEKTTLLYTEEETVVINEETGEEETVMQAVSKPLIEEQTSEGGTVWYQVNGGEWSTEVPTAGEAGKYTVRYKAVGDYLHRDSDTQTTVTSIVYDWATPTGVTATPAELTYSDYGSFVSDSNAAVFVGWDDNEKLDRCNFTIEVITPDGQRGKIIDSAPVQKEYWYELSSERPSVRFFVALLSPEDEQIIENGRINGAKYGDTIIITATGIITVDGEEIESFPSESVDLALGISNDGKTFPVLEDGMSNDSGLKADVIVLGDKALAEGLASGGKAPYQFEFSYKKAGAARFTTAQSYGANQIFTLKPSAAGVYNIRVNAKDSDGTVVGKDFTVTVNKVLANLSTVSAEEIVVGDDITVTAAAEGGIGSYQYQVTYTRSDSDELYVAQEYGENSTVTITPPTAGDYTIKVTVRDDRDVTVTKTFGVKVNKLLANNSVISADEIVAGDTLTVNAAAEGGMGSYLYQVTYTRADSNELFIAQEYAADNEVTFKPPTAGDYTVKVTVKDGRNITETKTFSVKVNKLLANTSVISAEEIVIGDSVTVTAGAEGGMGSYQYQVTYTRSDSNELYVAQEYGANSTVTFTPAATGDYNVKVAVRDGRDVTETKTFSVKVNKLLANTSAVSAEETVIGEALTVTAGAEGGIAPYKYQITYTQGDSDKLNIVQEYSENTTVTVTPDMEGILTVKVDVMDQRGTVESKAFNVKVNKVLTNLSTISSENIYLGETVTVNAVAEGGIGEVSLTILYKKSSGRSWTTLGTGSTGTFKPGAAVPYDVQVKAQDSAGTVSAKTFTVTVYPVLMNTSSVSAEQIIIGDYITVAASASGGAGGYTYEMSYRKASANKWIMLGGGADAAASFKPDSVSVYEIKTVAKDKLGKTAAKTFSVNVCPVLNNSSVIAIDGDVTLTARAEGGIGAYSYETRYRKASEKEWTLIGYGTEGAFTPEPGESYEAVVIVTDEAGNIKAKRFAFTVIPQLENTSTLSSDSIAAGDRITMNGSATGGTGSIVYTYYYKRENAANWTTLGDKFTSNTTASVRMRNVGKYLVRIIAMDELGETSTADLAFEVTDAAAGEFTNTSSVSAESISAGQTVTITGASENGTAPVTYTYYYKRTTSKNWNTMTSADGASASVRLRNAGSYEFRSVATDASGKTAERIITVTVG